MRKLSILTVFVLTFFMVNSQNTKDYKSFPHYNEMIKDPNANFFETQKAFEKYWEGKKVGRGYGWKQFKRWEWFMKTRVDENGNKPAPDKIIKGYQEFITKSGKSVINNSNWTNLGPIALPDNYLGMAIGNGRINTIAFHPSNPHELMVGSPSGGLWRTIDGGDSWEPLSDEFPTLGVSAIAYDPKNPSVIYVGTGDRDGGDAPGLGIMKTVDGGLHWDFIGNNLEYATINKLYIHPDSSEVIYAGTTLGFFKSEDYGETWDKLQLGNIKDFQLKPGSSKIIYTTISGNFYKSTDWGNSWKRITNGINSGNRMVIGVSPARPDNVYVLVSNYRDLKGFFFSEDNGESFELQFDSPNILGYNYNGNDDGGQSYYDLCIAIDPAYPNRIFIGGINLWKSDDYGKTWSIIGHWYGDHAPNVHADQHFMDISPLDGNLYLGNDGGVYKTSNNGDSWSELTGGLAISQIYKLGQSATSRDKVMNGYQDNGSMLFENGDWKAILGGDGMECAIDYENPNIIYGSLYYGDIRRTKSGTYFARIAGYGVNGITEEGGWVTPYKLHTTNPNTMFIGYKNIWRSKNVQSNNSVSWTKISSSLAGSNSDNIVAIEQSNANPDIFYFSRNDSKFFRSKNINDDSPAWDDLSYNATGQVIDIETHPYDENILYIVKSNDNIYRSTSKGGSWKNISLNLPNIDLNCIVFDTTTTEGLYVGTDAGVYYKDADMDEWILYGNGFPVSAEVTELEIYYHPTNKKESRLRASTYGRGLWSTPLYEDQNTYNINVTAKSINLPSEAICLDEPVTPSIEIENNGTDTVYALYLNLILNNDTIENITTIDSIFPSLTKTYSFSQVTPTHGLNTFAINIDSVSHQKDENPDDNFISDTLRVSENNGIILSILTDTLASETSWKLFSDDVIVMESEDDYEDGVQYNSSTFLCLDEGCYKFYIYDEGGNGICCNHKNGLVQLYNYDIDTLIAEFSEFESVDSIEFCIHNYNLPSVEFSVDTNNICINNSVVFTDESEGENLSYYWNFGEGANPATATTSGSHKVTYNLPGFKTVSLEISNSKGSIVESKINFIEVIDTIKILSQSNPVIEKCAGDSVIMFVEYNNANSVKWYKNDVSFEITDQYIVINDLKPDNSGNYVCMIINECDTLISNTIELVVHDIPVMQIEASGDYICEGESVTLTASGADSYSWTTTTENTNEVIVTPDYSTLYTVIGTNNTTGCQNIASHVVNVELAPTITKDLVSMIGCEGQTVVLNIWVLGSNLNYDWKKGNEAIENNSPFLVFEEFSQEDIGNYTCRVYNSCGEVLSQSANIELSFLPTVDFSYSTSNLTVDFTSINENANRLFWSFGDSDTSNIENPSHNYLTSGSYEVIHTAFNDCGAKSKIDTIALFTDAIMELISNTAISVYPNPNDGNFELSFKEGTNNAILEIYSTDGKRIYQQNIETIYKGGKIDISLSNKKGLYLLKVSTKKEVYHKMVIIR